MYRLKYGGILSVMTSLLFNSKFRRVLGKIFIEFSTTSNVFRLNILSPHPMYCLSSTSSFTSIEFCKPTTTFFRILNEGL